MGQEEEESRDERLDQLLKENMELKKDMQEIKQLLLDQSDAPRLVPSVVSLRNDDWCMTI